MSKLATSTSMPGSTRAGLGKAARAASGVCTFRLKREAGQLVHFIAQLPPTTTPTPAPTIPFPRHCLNPYEVGRPYPFYKNPQPRTYSLILERGEVRERNIDVKENIDQTHNGDLCSD